MTQTMTETVRESANEAGEARTKPAAQVLRWLATGIVTLVVLSLVGGLLVGLLAGQSFESNAAVEQCAKAIRVFDLLLVTPLAIGVAAALVVGVPTARVFRARRSDPGPEGRPRTGRDILLVGIAAVSGFVTTALFWSVSGLVVPGTSIAAAHWINGDSADRLHKDFYGFKLPSVENWSIIQSMTLALLLVAVACVAGWRSAPGDQRVANRRVQITAAVLTVALGAFFAWHSTQSYHDVRKVKVTAEQGLYRTVSAEIPVAV